jgi:predicted transcriptional regulator
MRPLLAALTLALLPSAAVKGIRSRRKARRLKHPLQARIRDAVRLRPGIMTQDLATELGCNRSTLRYHLALMQEGGVLRAVFFSQRSRFFLAEVDPQAQDALAVLQRGRTWDLARQVAENPGLPQCDLTDGLQMSRKVMRKYLDRLVKHGLVEEVDDAPYLTYYPTRGLHKMVAAWDPARLEDEEGAGKPLVLPAAELLSAPLQARRGRP